MRRREVVAGLLACPSLAPRGAGAQAVTKPAEPEGQRFGPSTVADLARDLARKPYAAPQADLPAPYANLPYDTYVAIRPRPSARIWDGEGRGFMATPLLRGFVFTTTVNLFTVEDGIARRVVFDRERYDFGALRSSGPPPDPGYSGLRLESTAGGGTPFEFAILQGATFFRVAARGQNFGTIARALTVNPGETRGEEFPNFKALWIERPSPASNALVLHGLIDSESVAGAVRLTFRPGEATIVDVETTLFPRVALDHVGLGGMTAMFLFGPNVRRTTDDVRPAVYEASGLSVLNGQGEWLWRPINNPDTLQISAFLDENPKGFGFVQRERDFAAFGDDVQHFELRPSLWIEPLGDWRQGAVQLIEIPSDAEVNKNFLAYWRPKAPMPAGQEVSFAYRQFWGWAPPERSALAAVTSTRSGRGSSDRRRRFVVEFAGETLGAVPPDLKPAVSASPGTIAGVRHWTYPDRKVVRVAFELEFGGETACELRLVLQSGAKPLSETWLYRWTS